MENKFISPYKCNFLVGIFNFPLIIIIYIIISFTPLGNKNNKNYYVYNFFSLFEEGLNIINAFRLYHFLLYMEYLSVYLIKLFMILHFIIHIFLY